MTRRPAALAALVATALAEWPAAAQSIHATGTIAGQPLVAPPGPMEMVATRSALAAGRTIDTHMHFWPRYVFVESGEVEVTLLDGGPPRTFRAGQMIVEPLRKWHSGKVIRDAVLIAVEQVPPGECNTVKPPAKDGAPNDGCPPR